ncbi:MAG: LuxR C-terminal-related transcriptional regulator [Pseudomonadota bacterium]
MNALLRLAHFDPIEIDLANHLLDTNQTLALLEEASRRTGFVRREGHAKQFRLHPVFRDVLVDLAEQQIPSDVTALLTRAAKWFETNGDWLAAANAWSQVSSSDRAIAVLAEHADELVTGRGEVASFRAMTRRLPASSTAMLAPEIALGAIFGGDFAGAVSILDDRAIAEDKLTQKQIIRRDALSVVIESGLGSDGRVAAAAHSWLKTHPNAEPRFRAIVAATYFTACHINLDMPGANRALELLEDCLSSTDSPFIAGWFDIFSAMHRIEKGALFAADQILAAAPSSGANKATLQLAKAVVAWETGDARKTQKLIDRHMDEGLRHATIEIALLGLQTAIELKWETSGLEAALEFSREADAWMEGVHGGLGAKALRLFVAAFKLKRGLRTSEQEERQLAHAVESALEHPHASARLKERAKLLLARHATLNDDPRLAISTLQPILRETHQHGRLRPWCQASIIYAGALARKGEQDRAVRMAKKAIATCAELGLHETICSDNLLLAPLAKDLMAAARKQGAGLTGESHFRAVIKELARRTGTISAVDLQDEPGAELAQADVNLTKTELKVLILAAEGASNSQIAERMTVKLSTVKWHMQNVFRKLQAPSRTAAIASGRRLGILS